MIYVENIIYIASFILAIFALVGVLNFIHTDNYLTRHDYDQNGTQTIDPNEDIKILNTHMVKTESSIPAINGQAQNTGQYTMRYVSITVNFYDKNGKLLYSGFYGKSYISPGEVWNFEVPCRKSMAPYSYKVEIGPAM